MNDLYVRGGLCPFRNQYKNIRFKALKLFAFRRFLHSALARAMSTVEMTMGTGFKLFALSFALLKGFPLLKRTTYHLKLKRLSAFSFMLSTFLFCVCLVHAGQRGLTIPAATGVAFSADSIKPLQIGDTIPEALWNLPLQMVKAGQEGSTTVTLNDYKGKLIILDFWATWCGPCVAMIPKMDSLQQAFGSKIQFLSVTYQKKEDVLPFLERLSEKKGVQSDLPIIAGDNTFRATFPHRTLPHYVWIGTNGSVLATTGWNDMNAENLIAALEKKDLDVTEKIEKKISYDKAKLLAEQNLIDFRKSLIGYSSFNRYLDGITSMFRSQFDTVQGFRASYLNVSLLRLFLFAYHDLGPFDKRRVILNVKNSNKLTTQLTGSEAAKWMVDNTYCYEVFIPFYKGLTRETFYKQARADLKRFLPMYTCKVEKKKLRCYALVKMGNSQPYKTKVPQSKGMMRVDNDGFQCVNRNLSFFLFPLNKFYLQNSRFPIVDNTGYKGNVDLDLKADMRDMDAINSALKKYNLQFVVKDVKVDVLIVEDLNL